jgi:hypothetical protein
MISWSGDIENYCNILPIFPPQGLRPEKLSLAVVFSGNIFIGNILLPRRANVPLWDTGQGSVINIYFAMNIHNRCYKY